MLATVPHKLLHANFVWVRGSSGRWIIIALHSLPRLNRLLVVHGLNDENVFFTHTSLLIDQLVALGKPYQLQVYTGERHGLRSPSSVLHCDGTVLSFLKQHL